MFILGYIFESGRARAEVQLRAALEKLARSNERLVHLNSEKDEFLGIAAHDLKNPLTVILAGADLMRVTRDLEEISPIAGGIIQAAERMRNLISNLLDVHAIENGQFASNLERCELGGVVGEIVGQNRAAASQKKIAIELAATEGLFVETDRAAAVQILDNLISNAVKYSPLESRVRVEVGRENGEALVAVRDEGPGISAEDQKKLFQKYGRLSARPTGGESSNGLGLAIAKRLAESLSGTIECRSVLGEGATFTLRLPLSRGEKLRES
jgi:signal transduction histidine kinase